MGQGVEEGMEGAARVCVSEWGSGASECVFYWCSDIWIMPEQSKWDIGASSTYPRIHRNKKQKTLSNRNSNQTIRHTADRVDTKIQIQRYLDTGAISANVGWTAKCLHRYSPWWTVINSAWNSRRYFLSHPADTYRDRCCICPVWQIVCRVSVPSVCVPVCNIWKAVQICHLALCGQLPLKSIQNTSLLGHLGQVQVKGKSQTHLPAGCQRINSSDIRLVA